MTQRFFLDLHNALPGILLITLVSILSGCNKETTEIKPEVIRPAKIFTVADPLMGTKRVYPGEVKAGDRSEQAFRLSGELIKLPAKAGMKIKKGQLLAELDPSDFQLTVDEQQAKYDLAKIQYDRVEELVKKQLIPRSDFDKAKSGLLTATADLKMAKAKLSYTQLRAPFDGIISKLNVKNHENVRQNEVILVIQTTNNIEIVFNLSENIISRIKNGRGKEIHPDVVFDTYPDKRYSTNVQEFDTEADPQTRSYKVKLIMPSPKEFIALPGMSVNVHLDFSDILKTPDTALIVPVEAVFSPENKPLKSKTHTVWTVDNNMKTHLTQITIGEITSQGITIVSGLQPGDKVITAGVNFIKEGQTIKPWKKESGL